MIAEVRVDLGVWSLDRDLSYAVPKKLETRVALGSVVRVPLRGRRVRGWVTAISEEDPLALQEIASVGGRAPVFDGPLLSMARAMSRYYVHPLSSFLGLMTPPRAGVRLNIEAAPITAGSQHFLGIEFRRTAAGEDPTEAYSQEIDQSLSDSRAAIVVVPEVREGSAVLHKLAARFSDEAAVVHSGIDPAERSRGLWELALGRKRIALGGRAAVFAPVFGSASIIIHNEHDRSLKDQRSPYYDARRVAIARARFAGGKVVLTSSTPSLTGLSLLGAGNISEPTRAEERSTWPIVEVLDTAKRGLPRRAIAAIIEAVGRGERSIVLLPRARATAAGFGPEEIADFVRRVVPQARVGRADRAALGPEPGKLASALEPDVVVATEAALAEVERPRFGTAIAAGVDSWLAKPSGAGTEEAFEVLWTLGRLVSGRPKGRLLVETTRHDHYVVQALTRGDYHFFARHELEVRRSEASPPFVTLIRVQVASEDASDVGARLARLDGYRVLGPIPGRLGNEFLVKAENHEPVAEQLREIVAMSGERVLVEVDPREW